jgi:predicted esterase
MATFYLGALDGRPKALVAGLTPLWWQPDIISPGHFAAHVQRPLLLLMGRSDSFYKKDETDNVFQAIKSPKELVWYDVGHKLPDAYAAAAAAWFRKYLPQN